MMWFEIIIVLLLIIFNGALAMAELAVVSSNKHRLKMLADRGSRGGKIALALAEDPARFLSTVQIGITLVGVLAGAFGGATLSEQLGVTLDRFEFINPYGPLVAMLIVVVGITFLSIVIGELVPKQLALRNPERIAATMALPMSWILRLAWPAVKILEVASNAVLHLIGKQTSATQGITEEEVKAVIHEGARAGVLKNVERDMLSGVMRLADRRAELIMTEREHFTAVDLEAPSEQIWLHMRQTTHTRVIAVRGEASNVVGLLETREVLARLIEGGTVDFDQLLSQPPRIRPDLPATEALEILRTASSHMLFVVDAEDEVIGVVTALDILNAIVPGFGARSADEGTIVTRSENSWLVDGDLLIDVLADHLGLISVPKDRSFDSVAGFMLWHLEHLPVEGEVARIESYLFEVVDMDGPRIDKVLVTRLADSTVLDDALDSG